MSKKDIKGMIEELETQFEGGFEKYDKEKVESTCRTCMYLGQFTSPGEMGVILKGLQEKFPTGFNGNDTYEVANEFKVQLEKYLNTD